jgi:hypothetical protein
MASRNPFLAVRGAQVVFTLVNQDLALPQAEVSEPGATNRDLALG